MLHVDVDAPPVPPFRDYRVSAQADPAPVERAADLVASAERPMVFSRCGSRTKLGPFRRPIRRISAASSRIVVDPVSERRFTGGAGSDTLDIGRVPYAIYSKTDSIPL